MSLALVRPSPPPSPARAPSPTPTQATAIRYLTLPTMKVFRALIPFVCLAAGSLLAPHAPIGVANAMPPVRIDVNGQPRAFHAPEAMQVQNPRAAIMHTAPQDVRGGAPHELQGLSKHETDKVGQVHSVPTERSLLMILHLFVAPDSRRIGLTLPRTLSTTNLTVHRRREEDALPT